MSADPPCVDVAVVGAGLAGLHAARLLHRFGHDVAVLEREATVGGRVRTDHLDGYRLDHGFQLFNPAYPAAGRAFDLPALDLRPFGRGAAVVDGRRRSLLADPRRTASLGGTTAAVLSGRVAPAWEMAALGAYATACAAAPPQRLRNREDVSIGVALRRWGVGTRAIERVAGPFLSGVFADVDLSTSRRYADLVLRTFVKGSPAVPATGMQALPEQIAAELPAGVVRTEWAVQAISPGLVETAHGPLACRVVIVATDAAAAGRLVPALKVPAMASLTTWYFATDAVAAADADCLVLDGSGDPWLCHVADMAAAAPGYAPAGRRLIAASAVGYLPQAEAAAEARRRTAGLLGAPVAALAEIARYPIRNALPRFLPGTPLRRRVVAGPGLIVVGDHRDTPSIQGALVSGERGAEAAVRALGLGRAG